MPVIRPELHTSLATQILNDIQYRRANFFYYLGKVEPWADETIPPLEPSATVESDIETRNNIVFMRKVAPVDASLVITRYSWESGLVFEQWDHTQLMQGTMFYCVTDEFNVYKCLNNNNGASSTVKPTGSLLSPFQTADGYIWKYMYSIPAVKQLKFVSDAWVPVQKALTDAFYSKGAIEQVEIFNGGSGYVDVLQTTIGVEDETGSGAVIVPFVSRTTGEIVKVEIINGGSGYTDPTLTVLQATETGTGKFNNNPTAILKAIVQDGEIVNVAIEDPGQNYPTDTSTTILVQGNGTGAEISPVVYGGEVIGVVIENPGLNYSFVKLTVIGTGEGASLQATLALSDFLSDQSLVEQTAVPGAIYAVKVANAGNNYSSATTVTITGDGSGAAGYPVIAEGGLIEKIVMTSYGSGYSRATITITDPNRVPGVGFVDAQAYAILPSIMGHGFDAVKELYGSTVLVYTLIKDEIEMNLLLQDYRQFGLIENPLYLITNQRVTDNSAIITFDIVFLDATGIEPDDVLISNNTKYRVVDVDENLVRLQQFSAIYKQPGTSFVQENDPNSQYAVVRIASSPTVNKYSGNLLYVTNNPPLTSTEDQAFAIRTYIRF
jgi:hypothetical protein